MRYPTGSACHVGRRNRRWLVLPQTLGVTRGYHAQAEQNHQYPQHIWFTFHRMPPPSKAQRGVAAAIIVIGPAAAAIYIANLPIQQMANNQHKAGSR